MERMHSIQYTVRSIPPGLDKALRQEAKKSGKSLNRVILETLAKRSELGGVLEEHVDLNHFFGSWVRDPALDEALKDQRKVDDSLWQ